MASPLVIGLDLGTTACKAVALGIDGRVMAATEAGYPTYTPHEGWAEQRVDEVWVGAARALREVTGRLHGATIDGLGISGAMHSLLPVRRDGGPLAPAMIWSDSRAADELDALRREPAAGELAKRTGCPLQVAYHPARLRWWLHEDGEPTKADLFVAIKDWVTHRLTGAWATDLGLASTTGLFDIRTMEWDDAAVALAGVTRDSLPRLAKPQALVGRLGQDAARETGLAVGLPVFGGGSDGGMAMIGSGATKSGYAVVTVGTSGAVRLTLDRPDTDSTGKRWCYVLADGLWITGGAINNGGLALQWVRDSFYADSMFERMIEEGAAIAPGAEDLVMLPYLTGERSPHWDASARAAFVGLALHHSRGHVARAAMEAVAFCLADVWETVKPGRGGVEPILLTGGIRHSPAWCAIVADVLGEKLRVVDQGDASAIGAAVIAQWGLGLIDGLSASAVRVDGPVIESDPARHALYRGLHRQFQELGQRFAFGNITRG